MVIFLHPPYNICTVDFYFCGKPANKKSSSK
jgi:hypothetical protein